MNRILVIDDDEDMQMLYSEAISEERYEVLTIGDERISWNILLKSVLTLWFGHKTGEI